MGSDLETDSKMLKRHRILAVGRLLLLLAPWVFIGYLFRDVDAVVDTFEGASVAPMVGGLLLTLLGLVGLALLWTRLVGHLCRDVAVPDTPHLLRSFARSWLARYLPGKVWSYGARVVHTDASVTPRRIVASSLVDEFTLIVGSATALGLGLWTWAAAGAVIGVPVLITAITALVVAVSRLDQLTALALRFLARAMPQRWRSAAEEMQRAADDPGLGLKASVLFTAGYLMTNILLGSAFVLIVLSLSDVGWADVPLLIGGYNLAGVLGIVAFFAPAGLGVKEGVLVGFLTSVVASPVAATLVVSVRLVTIVADVALLGLVEGVSLFTRTTNREALPDTAADSEHGVKASPDR